MYRRTLIAALVALGSGGAIAQAADSFVIVMSDAGSANPFWAAVADGAATKGAELGVPVAVLAPPGGETDVAGQIAIVEDQLAKGVTGIAIAPTDPNALAPTLQQAMKQGVKVVFIDKSANVEGVSYIGTNNEPAAGLGASYLCDNLKAGSEVAILQGTVTNTTGQARAKGARDTLMGCGLNIVAEQPADWDTGKALSVTENMLTAHPNIKGIFAANDNMALGAVEAVKAAKLQVTIVGFDGTPGAAEAILKGELAATVAQRPTVMGSTAVESLLKLNKGESVEANTDTGATLVTKDNAEDYN